MSKIKQTKQLNGNTSPRIDLSKDSSLKKCSLALSGSQVNLTRRESSPRVFAPKQPRYRAEFPWRRPASAGAVLAHPNRLGDSCHGVRSCLALCQQSGFCGSDALLQEAATGCKRYQGHGRKPEKDVAWTRSREIDAEAIDTELMRYAYTAESARLLESLLREPWKSGESTPVNVTSREAAKNESPRNDEILIDTERTASSVLEIPSKDSGRTGSTSFLQEDKKESEMDLKFKRWFSATEQPEDDSTPALIEFDKNVEKISTDAQTPRDSTLDELANILQELEDDDTPEGDPMTPTPRPGDLKTKPAEINDIFNYLDQAEKCSEGVKPANRPNHEPLLMESSIPRMEELLCRSSVDLAQEVLTFRLQAEEQADAIKLLQQTIKDMKLAGKEKEAVHQKELSQAVNEAETTLTRHQKMVKQLLAEKKSLNEKMTAMMTELKSTEERNQRNLKAMEERHLVEIQRLRETHAAAEKLKREKWIDVKTQKIKEMTVKGLEPELSRMAARQQQELTELRNLHRSELEAVELRAARRTTELMDELRAELTRDKEESLQREAAVHRLKLEKRLEDEVRLHEQETRRLKDELRHERDRLNGLEIHVQEQLAESRRSAERERERERATLTREWQEKLDELLRQHQIELKNLKEALEMEKDVWMDNYKKIQGKKFLDREADIRHQYKRERDRDIEIAIERLETEATKATLELTEASENRLKRLREKFEGDIKELEIECGVVKTKLSEMKQQFGEKDDENIELQGQVRHLQHEFNQLKKICEEMAEERADLRKILRAELNEQLTEAQVLADQLREDIMQLKTQHAVELAKKEQILERIRAEKEEELQRVYNRVKTTIRKKDEALEAQKEQNKVALERCSHLKQMLDNQRKNLLLK